MPLRPTAVVPAAVPLTLYQAHVQQWCNCEACELSRYRRNVVLARGTIPCDVCFIGEAPGKSEDVAGLPFWGPAGEKLDWIISRSITPYGLTWASTNLVCCIPRAGSKGAAKTERPPPEAVDACAPRLKEFVAIAMPRLIVAVGSEARDMLDPRYHGTIRFDGDPIPQVHIIHPSFVLRQSTIRQGVYLQQSVIAIVNALEDNGLIGEGAADRHDPGVPE